MTNDDSILSLSMDDYRELLRLAYLGEWLVNAQHDGEHQDEPAQAALQQVMAAAKATDVVRQDPETNEYFVAPELVEAWFDAYISDYDDHVFWDELIERLAVRDLAERRGVSPDTLEREDHLLELKPIEERYRSEFEDYGVNHLEIVDEL